MVLCACGCGELIPEYDRRGRRIYYKKGHYWNGRQRYKETSEKVSATRKLFHKLGMMNIRAGANHTDWKGNNVGYSALHKWVRKNKPKPESCEFCHVVKSKYHLANITGVYRREFYHWRWLCIQCHRSHDARTKRIESFMLSVFGSINL